MRQKRYDKKLAEQKGAVPHLYSSVGFLDGQWWHRTYWQFGSSMRSCYGGWPVVGKSTPAGRIMAVDEDTLYAYGRLNQYSHIGSHVGLGKMKYVLYAKDRNAAKTAATKKGQAKNRKRRPSGKVAPKWTQQIPILARGMVLSKPYIFIAGPPDVFGTSPEGLTHPYNSAPAERLRRQEDSLAGKMGASLIVVDRKDGKQLKELKLDAPPVWDGMVGVEGKLFIAGTDGKVLCIDANKGSEK